MYNNKATEKQATLNTITLLNWAPGNRQYSSLVGPRVKACAFCAYAFSNRWRSSQRVMSVLQYSNKINMCNNKAYYKVCST